MMTLIEGGQMVLLQPGEELAEVIAAAAKSEMAEHLRDAARFSAEFIDGYAFQYVTNRARSLEGTLTMHSKMRELARELVKDEAAALRLRGRVF